VIDPATNTITTTIAIGDRPNWAAYDGTNIYIATWAAGNVWVLDPRLNTVAISHTVGTNPRHILFDGANLFVTNEADDSLSKILPL
jgi:DNA-binding beta-propeller fold protein YncE